MATLGYDENAQDDLARIALFLAQDQPAGAGQAIQLITGAVDLLRVHPMIGRPAPHGFRELVISHGATGYVALYDYSAENDHVQVNAIRHQRETGFDD